MKTLQKRNIALIILGISLSLLHSNALAQVGEGITIDYPHIAKPRLTETGGTVTVTFKMVIPADNFRANQMISMVPILKNEAGETSLTPITVTGNRKKMSDRRKRFLAGYDLAMQMTVIQGQAGEMDYKSLVPYSAWMQRGELALFLDQSKVGYRKTEYLGRIPLRIEGEEEEKELVIDHIEPPATLDTSSILEHIAQSIEQQDYATVISLIKAAPKQDSMWTATDQMLQNEKFASLLGSTIQMQLNDNFLQMKFNVDTVPLGATYQLAQKENFVVDKKQFWADKSLKRDGEILGIYFRSGYNTLEPDYMNNGETLQRILNAIHIIQDDPNARLVGIRIIGQSSPEGSALVNEALAQRRADHVKIYLMSQTGLPQNNFNLGALGAAWAELRYLVAHDDFVVHKKEIISAIDEVPFSTADEVLGYIKKKWPEDAAYIARSLFPLLRNATFLKIYFEDNTNPQEYVFTEAMRLLDQQEFSQALALLETIKENQKTWLPLAICYAMTGQTAMFNQYIEKL